MRKNDGGSAKDRDLHFIFFVVSSEKQHCIQNGISVIQIINVAKNAKRALSSLLIVTTPITVNAMALRNANTLLHVAKL